MRRYTPAGDALSTCAAWSSSAGINRAQGEARQRSDHHGQQHRHQPDEDAVAELAPEILDQPVSSTATN